MLGLTAHCKNDLGTFRSFLLFHFQAFAHVFLFFFLKLCSKWVNPKLQLAFTHLKEEYEGQEG